MICLASHSFTYRLQFVTSLKCAFPMAISASTLRPNQNSSRDLKTWTKGKLSPCWNMWPRTRKCTGMPWRSLISSFQREPQEGTSPVTVVWSGLLRWLHRWYTGIPPRWRLRTAFFADIQNTLIVSCVWDSKMKSSRAGSTLLTKTPWTRFSIASSVPCPMESY